MLRQALNRACVTGRDTSGEQTVAGGRLALHFLLNACRCGSSTKNATTSRLFVPDALWSTAMGGSVSDRAVTTAQMWGLKDRLTEWTLNKMSKRHEIIEPPSVPGNITGFIYTDVLGWVDLGRASGEDIKELLAQFQLGEQSSASYYPVAYTQRLRANTGRYVRWHVRRGRTADEIYSIALAMIMRSACLFEGWQAQPGFNWYTDSGFSGEALVSDLLGFYHITHPANYMQLIKPVSKSAALRRWDFYGETGSLNNKTYKPVLFPDPRDKGVVHKPYQAELPHFMRLVMPFSHFGSGIVRRNDNASISAAPGG